ncbi:SMC family ATPase [Microbacterium hatanonis]|uniref:SMC family ATPase n=1 Tax=Microbacterium hatanonis TaxID=404366 RepID=UPI0031D8CE3D
MKLHRLELAGFGPFLERQSVDFDAFADDGIFLIAGRTGAGKSSVLDGVCFALYGSVPRYESGEKRLRSDHCGPEDPTEVTLEFTAEGSRWRVRRSPEYERPKKNGGGFTTQAPQALLEEFSSGTWTGVAARPRDVAARLDEILGLTQQQFLQVILLAQNRFARFLLARNDERQALLRTLFATRTYEDYERELESRRKDAERALAAEGDTARVLVDEGELLARESDLDGTTHGAMAAESTDAAAPPESVDAVRPLADRVVALVRAVERAEYRVDTLARARDGADDELAAATERERAAAALRAAQEQRLTARAALEALEARAERIAEMRAELALANAAEALRSSIENAGRAESAARRAADAERDALARCSALGEGSPTNASLRDREDELAATIAASDAALAAEGERTAIDASLRAARESEQAMLREMAELDERRRPVPALLAQLSERLTAVAGAARGAESARAVLADTERRRAAAHEAVALEASVRTAEREALERGTAVTTTAARLTALLQRRLDGAAGDLAAALVDGEPCPVCGAVDHPHPAPVSDDPVGDDEIAAAEAEKDAAIDADRAAALAWRAARDAHALIAVRAGGDDVATLDAAVESAAAALSRAEADVSAAEALTAEHAELSALAEAAALEHARLTEALAEVRQRVALDEQRATTAATIVDAARGEFATVAERRADAVGRRDAVRALAEARAELALRTQVLADARADRDARLAASTFDDPSAVEAALRDPAARARLDDAVREHESAARAAKERLLELELALVDAPDELVDLDGPARAVAVAREAFTSAISALAAATGVAERLRDLTQRADAATEGITALADRHAVIARLANTVAGRAPNTHRMTLETFVLAAELEEIVGAANLRLAEMSSGRYRLQHSDALAARGAASGLGLEIMDAFTGQARPPQSLSGGESFLASLALALGLAEIVTARAGGLRLDTLFIDEGFGSLDDDTLDLAMRTLDELRQGGRTVGVISHVASMKEQVPAQLLVEATPQGPSVIRQQSTVAV